MHGAGAAAAVQLLEPTVLRRERDGVLPPERVLLQTPALPGASGSHGHHGQLDPVPSDVPPRVRTFSFHSDIQASFGHGSSAVCGVSHYLVVHVCPLQTVRGTDELPVKVRRGGEAVGWLAAAWAV